jgi:hypothetical protein
MGWRDVLSTFKLLNELSQLENLDDLSEEKWQEIMGSMTSEKIAKIMEGKPPEEQRKLMDLIQKLSVPIDEEARKNWLKKRVPPKVFKWVVRENDQCELDYLDKSFGNKNMMKSGSGFFSERTSNLAEIALLKDDVENYYPSSVNFPWNEPPPPKWVDLPPFVRTWNANEYSSVP